MRNRFGLLYLLLASIPFAAGGCVVAAEPPSVAIAAPEAYVWVGPGYYGSTYYHTYPGPGYYAPHHHYWR